VVPTRTKLRRIVTPPTSLTLSRRSFDLVATSNVAAVVLALVAARLVLAALAPLDSDETYYFLWSRFPAWSYYDHPPMVAWWIAVGTAVFGTGAFGIRVVSTLSMIPTSLAVYATGLVLFDRPIALRAVLWTNAMLLFVVGGIVATPDAPLVMFWAMAVLAMALVVRSGDGRWWLLVGLSAGLSVASKLTGLFLGPGILLVLLLRADLRKWLATPWPWAGGVVALLVVTPMLLWNAAHDWVTFTKQFGRVTSGTFQPMHFPEFLVTQFGLFNPIVAVFAGLAVVMALRDRASPRAQATQVLLLLILPLVGYMAVHSLHGQVQAQWLAPLYPSVALIAAAAAQNVSGRWQRYAAAAFPLGVVATGIAFVVLLNPGNFVPANIGPQLWGWEDVAASAEAMRQANGAAWIATTQYGSNAEVAYRLRTTGVPVIAIDERARYAFAPPPDSALLAKRVLLVTTDAPASFARCFGPLTPVGVIPRKSGRNVIEGYTAYVADSADPAVFDPGCDQFVPR
jgi:4-amino-4-deoxy-L-arabinose transferase-like glycosyltransferase